MDVKSKINTENKFSSLQAGFKSQLPMKISLIEDLWFSLCENNDNKDIFRQLHHDLLRLADTAGTYGAVQVSNISRKLELKLKPFIEENIIKLFLSQSEDEIKDCLVKLRKESEEYLAFNIVEKKINKTRIINESKIIYALIGDESLLRELTFNLEKASLKIRVFNKISIFEESYKIKAPDIIIVDEDFVDENIASLDVVTYLKNKIESCASIIYISNSSETELRLKSVRAGVSKYFYKPVEMNKVIHTIKDINPNENDLPYRVLLIDNDLALLECYDSVLSESGVIVESVSEALIGFERLESFKPDLILLDIYMPVCSGVELIKMIRQDDRWSLVPIIFLSGEQNIDNQLDAMSLGADDFLAKPVNTNKLITTVNATARRARNNIKLNGDLKNALVENRYQLVSLNKHAIVSSTDVAGRIIDVNDKLCEISGYTRKELIGKNHRVLKSSYHDKLFYDDLWKTISEGNVWHGVICNLTKNGDEYWVDSTIVPFIEEKGKPYKYVSIRTDVTDVRANEQRLNQSQEFSNIGTWDWNINTGHLYWSKGIWSLFGYDKDKTETSYDNFIQAIHPDDRNRVSSAIKNCIENNADYDIEHRTIWPDGSIHWLHESGDVIRNKAGAARHMLGVVRDITEIKESDIRQRGNNHILEMIVMGKTLNEIFEAIIMHAEAMLPDAKCSILLLDDSGKHLESCIAPHLPDFYNEAIDGVEIGMGVGSCGEAAFTGKRVIVDDIMTHENWTEYKELAKRAELGACWSEPFCSASKSVLGTFAIYFSKAKKPDDKESFLLVELAQFAAIAIERAQSRQILMNAKEEAEQANLAKSQFLSSMSHELRTPMNAIMGFSQLLKIPQSNSLSEVQEQNVDEIIMAGKHLMKLINEVLDLSKIESGQIDLSISKVKVGMVINESLQLILPLAQKRGIEIIFIKDDKNINLEELSTIDDLVCLDKTRFKQVLLNLMSNAVKYNSEKGKIIINFDRVDNEQFQLSITDTGYGVNEKQKQELFTAYNRLGLEETEIEGTGIGLVITKKIVELMEGSIGVESKIGIGSTFWVKFPFNLDHNSLEKTPYKAQHLVDNVINMEDQNKSVLYIEDNPANLRLVEKILENIPKLSLWSAPEPKLGLELAVERLPDLILLDINLPGMNGFEVLEKLRSNSQSKKIPVIAVSANAMPKDIEKGNDAGFDGYVTKPINVKELLTLVESEISNVKM